MKMIDGYECSTVGEIIDKLKEYPSGSFVCGFFDQQFVGIDADDITMTKHTDRRGKTRDIIELVEMG